MKLERVSIKNFRSIKQLELDFNTRCRVLVGINESGKSNILKALNLLDPKENSTPRDKREVVIREKPIDEAYVRFIFNFSNEEIKELYNLLAEKVLFNSPNEILFNGISKLSLKAYCESKQVLYVANVLTDQKYFTNWKSNNLIISKNWKEIADACPVDFTIKNKKGENIYLKNYVLVNSSEFKDIPDEYLADASSRNVIDLVDEFTKKIAKENLPEVLFWNYDDDKILPPKINLQVFCDNPDSCTPLKRMFNLYGIWKIKEEIDNAKQGSSNTLSNLLKRVAEKTTKHFHETWNEYNDIKFSLTLDGPDVKAAIEDKSNHYELSQRSDGFKRFITFLLLVSVRSTTNLFRDSVLLIDEPEIGLHPKGSRYLRDELIKISKNNHVIFSTHSIFMIDSQLISRHLIVKKKDEITHVTEVSDSNIQDEEVIYKSLGYSIFSSLKEKNLIFEGWRDKKLFETALLKVPKKFNGLKVPLNLVGHCFAQGVKGIPSITPLFETGERKCLILSDNDLMAINKQKEYQNAKGYGTWKRYSEIDCEVLAITGEDFVKAQAFSKIIDDIKSRHTLPGLPDLLDTKGKIYAIRQWLLKNNVSKDDTDKYIREIKDDVFENLKNSEISSEYYTYLTGVVTHLAALK